MHNGSTDDIDYGRLFMTLPTPHIILRPDKDLTIVQQNREHARITLTKRKDIVGKPLLVAFPDISEEFKATGISQLAESFKRVALTKKPDLMPILNYNLHDKNGKLLERWWRVKHYPLFDNSGEVALVYQVTEDITKEIKLQQDHKRLNSQLNSALEIGLVSAWNWDIKRDVVTADKNLARSFGVTAAQARSGLPLQTFMDLIHPEDQAYVSTLISNCVNDQTNYNAEYRTINSKGIVQWVRARGKVLIDSAGRSSDLMGVLIDITDQKQVESRLAQIERQYSALFNSTIVAIAMATTDGNIIEVNARFLKMFGYTKKEFKQGMNSRQVSFYKNDVITEHLYNSLRTYREVEPTKKDYKRRDGTRFSGLVGAAMLPDSKDTFMAFIIDVTENEQLKQLNRAKDDFVALASHQLRSPVTIVKQYIGVLLNEMAGPLNSDQIQYLNTANNANNRQLTIINDLLKTAQIDTKGYNVSLQPKNFVKIINDVIIDYESVFESRKQTVVINCDVDVLIIKADESELKTCVANLLENASKYSTAGRTITVDISHENHRAILSVTDEGVGIAKENLEKIFEKFTRIDNELSDTVSGSGLGLFWVKRITEIHGGKLSIKSKLGKGTTIVVKLPL